MPRKFTHDPTPKQFDALERLYDSYTDFLLFGGGAGGGKSWVGCEWLLALALNFPGTSYFMARKVLKELKKTTLRTFFKVTANAGIKHEDIFRYYDQNSSIQFHNGSIIDLIELKYQPSDPEYESLGSVEYTAGWIEEAGEVPFKAFDTIKSRVGRNKNDEHNLLGKILLTCNPSKNWLYREFYLPFRENRLPDNYAFIQSLIDDNPRNEKGYKEKLIGLKDKALKERLLFGNWEYDDDPAALMSYDSITDLFGNIHVNGSTGYITADIARYGRDKTVICVWQGFKVVKVVTRESNSTTEASNLIRALMAEFKIPQSRVIVDEDGVGGGVVDELRCKGFVNNSKARLEKGKKQNYRNLKSQCYFNLADRVERAGIWIDTEDYKIREDLVRELEAVKDATHGTDKPKEVLSKDKVTQLLGRSPDLSDALMMREFFELMPRKGPKIL